MRNFSLCIYQNPHLAIASLKRSRNRVITNLNRDGVSDEEIYRTNNSLIPL
jgi:hypothetical protein